MNDLNDNFYAMVAVFFIATIWQIYVLRRVLRSLADPLLFFAITSAFSLGLGVTVVDSESLYLRIVFYHIILYLGFFIGLGRHISDAPPLSIKVDLLKFKLTLIIGCILFLLSNLIVWLHSGIVIFSDDPSLYKSAAYEGGLGFVRRINWGFGVFALIATTYWYLFRRSKDALFWLCLVILLSVSGGSKSALLPLFFALGLYFINPFLPITPSVRVPSSKLIIYMLVLVAVPVVIVFLIEQDSVASVFDAFVIRLFFYGDVLLYWGRSEIREHFMSFGFFDYLNDSFAGILGVLRIADYKLPVGNQFVQFSLPIGSTISEAVGPNLPFYVRGELYFGPWLAPLHSLFVGWIIGRVRRSFMQYRGSSILRYSLIAFFVYLSMVMPTEEGLAVSQFLDFAVVFIFVYAMASLFCLAKKTNRIS